jgi:hypothetical protein
MEADLTKAAMVPLDRIFRRRKMEARIVMKIHDALRVEPPEREAEQVPHLMTNMMTTTKTQGSSGSGHQNDSILILKSNHGVKKVPGIW